MKKPRLFFVSVALVVAFALLSLACGSVRQAAQRQQKTNDLKQIGLAYHSYCDVNRKGPANADDLMKLQPEASAALQKAKNGEYTIIWGVNLTDQKQFQTNGMSGTILGFEASAPTSGGAVLMCDGAAVIMTAAEFTGKPQAKPSSGTGK